MKIANKILTLALAFFIAFIPVSAPALALDAGTLAVNEAFYMAKDITLQPGSDESKMNFCWYSYTGKPSCYVQIAKKSEMAGNVFPGSTGCYAGRVSASSEGFNSNKVTVTGLNPWTEYVYRVGDGTNYSNVFSFKTTGSSYNSLYVSDVQIGASGNIASDTASWEKTISSALGKFSNTSFILSAGDQVDASKSEGQYDAFFKSPLLRSTPLATAVGNHDNGRLYMYHYNLPNESATNGAASAGDYWFNYGDTLYIVLNTNNPNPAAHDAFIGQAIAANPDAIWTIVMFHQSIYSSAAHATEASIIALRNSLYPVIDKYPIDVVLSGHDHCYTRTYQMLNGTAQRSQTVDRQGRVLNPTGTLYFTAGSASGSKYYDMKTTPEAYSAMRLQLKTPTFSNIEVTGSTLSITTYRVDTMKVIDTYTIVKKTASGFIDVPDSAWYSSAVGFLHRWLMCFISCFQNKQ